MSKREGAGSKNGKLHNLTQRPAKLYETKITMNESTMIDVTPVAENNPLRLAVATLDQTRAAACLEAFAPFLAKAEEWKKATAEIKITDISQTREMKFARESRLAMKELRVTVEKNRKRIKEDILADGRAVDAAAKIVFDAVEPLEAYLLTQEKFAENKEIERRAALKAEREAALQPYAVDTTGYLLADMTPDAFAAILGGHKAAHEAKIEADRKAEAERVAKEQAEAAERERIKAENARLKIEADAREKAMQIEREAAEAERKAIEEKARIERKAAEAAAKKERDAREKAEAELQRQKDAEAAAVKAKADAEKKAAKAPDKAKIIAFTDALAAVVAPECATDEGFAILTVAQAQLQKLLVSIIEKANTL